MASSHLSLLPGQPLLGGCFSYQLQGLVGKHPPQPHTLLAAQEPLSVDTIRSIFLIMCSRTQLFLQCFRLNRERDAAHPPLVCCCLTGAEMAQLCSCCPSSAQPGSCPFPSLPRCATSAAAPGRDKHNLTAQVHLYMAVAMQAASNGGASGYGTAVDDWSGKGKGKVRERDEE